MVSLGSWWPLCANPSNVLKLTEISAQMGKNKICFVGICHNPSFCWTPITMIPGESGHSEELLSDGSPRRLLLCEFKVLFFRILVHAVEMYRITYLPQRGILAYWG